MSGMWGYCVLLRGCCVGVAWVLRGCCVGAAWVLRALRGRCVGAACVLRGCCVDAAWMLHVAACCCVLLRVAACCCVLLRGEVWCCLLTSTSHAIAGKHLPFLLFSSHLFLYSMSCCISYYLATSMFHLFLLSHVSRCFSFFHPVLLLYPLLTTLLSSLLYLTKYYRMKEYDNLTQEIREFIEQQHLFFVATAPPFANGYAPLSLHSVYSHPFYLYISRIHLLC